MKIAILDLNPGVDRVIYLDAPLAPGKMNRAARTVFCSGSKAANQVILYAGLGAQVEYITFSGGPLGDACLDFTRLPGVRQHTIPTAAGVRVNTKVIDVTGTSGATELNERGGPVMPDELALLKTTLAAVCGDVDVLSLAGSIPQDVEKDVYKSILASNPAPTTILDCDGEALRQAISASPGLIKPNRYELLTLACDLGCLDIFRDFSTAPPTADACVALCGAVRGKLAETGVTPPAILCTLDADGSVYVDGTSAWFASAPKIDAQSFSGAGDCYLATFTHARHALGLDIPAAMARASATAAAKCALTGMQVPDEADVQALLPRVCIEKV